MDGADEDVIERAGREGREGEAEETTEREGGFGVDVERRGGEATERRGEKGGKEELETELGLAGGALADELGDGAAGNAAAEEGVEDGAAEGELGGVEMERVLWFWGNGSHDRSFALRIFGKEFWDLVFVVLN